MANPPVSRRNLLRGGLALAGACALDGAKRGHARGLPERPALVVLWLNGGPAGLFNSAGSFLASGAFGVSHDNVRDLGNDLYVDAGSLGALPAAARAHMASVNFSHGIVRPHDHARAAVLENGKRNQLLRMAAAMPVDAGIRCALVNDLGFPKGISAGPPAEAGATLDFVMDFEPTHAGADVRVECRREEVPEDPDRRRRGGDVAVEARVRVEERVREEAGRDVREERPGGRALLGQRAVEVEGLAHRGRCFVAGHRALGDGVEEARDLVDERVSMGAEGGGVHRQRRGARRHVASLPRAVGSVQVGCR